MSKARELAELGDVVTVDAGKVGIGTDSPATNLDVTGATNSLQARFGGTAGRGLEISTASTFSTDDAVAVISAPTATRGTMVFATAGSEAMRIDSSGNVLVGKTSATITTTGVEMRPGGQLFATQISDYALLLNRTTSTGAIASFRKDNVTVGTISVTGSATAYNTSSDYRLKENITPIQGASDIVKQMRPSTYTFKSDGSWHDGFLAHELQELHPRAVLGSKDAMKDEEYEVTPAVLDEDGAVVTEAVMGTRSVPDYQGVDYSKLTPILTAALQEALTKIDTLEAQNATFEARLAALEAV